MLNIAYFQRNANQNYNEISPHNRMANIKKIYKQKSTNNKYWRQCVKVGPSHTSDGNVN